MAVLINERRGIGFDVRTFFLEPGQLHDLLVDGNESFHLISKVGVLNESLDFLFLLIYLMGDNITMASNRELEWPWIVLSIVLASDEVMY